MDNFSVQNNTIIFLCFNYTNDINGIDGIIMDIYKIYSTFKNIVSKIYIYTDIVEIMETSFIYKKENISKFLREYCLALEGESEIIEINLIRTKEDLLENLYEFSFSDFDNILFYYSGHGNNGIVLPSGQILNFDKILDLIKFNKETFFIFIFDCCKFYNNLSYLYRGERFILRNKNLILPKIILICSYNDEENFTLTSRGSYFTRRFNYCIRKKIINFKNFINNLHTYFIKKKSYHKIGIFATRNFGNNFPLWLYGKSIEFNDTYLT